MVGALPGVNEDWGVDGVVKGKPGATPWQRDGSVEIGFSIKEKNGRQHTEFGRTIKHKNGRENTTSGGGVKLENQLRHV
jgi:hypothetical protein